MQVAEGLTPMLDKVFGERSTGVCGAVQSANV